MNHNLTLDVMYVILGVLVPSQIIIVVLLFKILFVLSRFESNVRELRFEMNQQMTNTTASGGRSS